MEMNSVDNKIVQYLERAGVIYCKCPFNTPAPYAHLIEIAKMIQLEEQHKERQMIAPYQTIPNWNIDPMRHLYPKPSKPNEQGPGWQSPEIIC